MKFTIELTHAINIIQKIEDYYCPARVQDLVPVIGGTVSHLEQILSDLRRAGYVKSVRGPGGGYVKSDVPVTLYDLFRLFSKGSKTPADNTAAKRVHDHLTTVYKNIKIRG